MNQTLWMTLANNAVLLLGLFAVFEATYLIPEKYSKVRQGISALFIILVCVAVMSSPFVLYSGVVFDTRSIVISITSYVFGPFPAVITMAVATLLRWSLGGEGMWAGVAVILTSGMIGLFWRRIAPHGKIQEIWKTVYSMGIVVHLVMLLCQWVLIPNPRNLFVLQQIALPVMVIYPLVSALLILMLLRQQNYRQIQKDLEKSEEKYQTMFQSAGIGICNTDLKGKIIDANPRFEQILGYSRVELRGMTFEELTHPLDQGLTEEALRKMFRGDIDRFSLEKRYVDKIGRTVYGDLSVSMVRDELGNPLYTVTTVQDITEKKVQEEQISYLFTHDSLTRLYNRRYFNQEKVRLDQERLLPLSVILVNINGLRLINNGFGKDVGDQCIRETAVILEEIVQNRGSVSRISGDEFWILMPKTNEEEARNSMNAIDQRLKEKEEFAGKGDLTWSLSMGTATRSSMDQTMDEVLRSAEEVVENKRLLSHQSSRNQLVASMMATLAERSHETESHAKRLALLCRKIGERLNLSVLEQDRLELFSMLHDVGKTAIDSRILNKPGRLNEEEWLEMKKHPGIGFRIALSTVNLEPIAQYILTHHERWDGTGYPEGLSGEDIPTPSRILALADAYDAMTEDRVYRKAMKREDAMEEIRRNLNSQFDPTIGQVFLDLLTEEKDL